MKRQLFLVLIASALAGCGGGETSSGGAASGAAAPTPVAAASAAPAAASQAPSATDALASSASSPAAVRSAALGGFRTPYTERMGAVESKSALPALERTSTVAGIDANTNGVRDDVEAVIATLYPEPKTRSAALQYARALQNSLLIDFSNTAAVKEAKRLNSRGHHCYWHTIHQLGEPGHPPSYAVSMMVAVTTNTKQRLLAYAAFNQALDGMSWAGPEGDTCDA